MDSNTLIGMARSRCRVCSSALRQDVDDRLTGRVLNDETEERLTFDEIVVWAGGQGLKLSKAGLSRHKNDHLMADLQQALEAQAVVESIAQATGKQLGLPQAFLNILIHKATRALENIDLDPSKSEKWLNSIIRATEALLKVERAEVHLSKEKVREAGKKLAASGRTAGVSKEALNIILRDVYGLIDEEPPADDTTDPTSPIPSS